MRGTEWLEDGDEMTNETPTNYMFVSAGDSCINSSRTACESQSDLIDGNYIPADKSLAAWIDERLAKTEQSVRAIVREEMKPLIDALREAAGK